MFKRKLKRIGMIYSAIMVLIIALMGGMMNVKADSSDMEFEEMTMIIGERISDATEEELKGAYQKVTRKMFGQSVTTLYNLAWFNYIGETVFSKTNLTREPISMEFQVKETTYNKISYGISGEFSTKVKASIKKIVDLEVAGKMSVDQKTENTYTKLESTKMSLTIEPGYRLILRSAGTGTLSNGVGKSFSFFITTKKYTWEVYEIKSATYELVEEKA